MNRNAVITLTALFCVCAGTARAQQSGIWNRALTQSTIDAAALGVPGRLFFEYSMGESFDYGATAGFGLAGGALRLSYLHHYRGRDLGLGYARTIVRREVGLFGTSAAGLDLFAAYRGPGSEARAVRLAVPLSLRWGSPNGLSIAPYVAPYAEMGRDVRFYNTCPDFVCTHFRAQPFTTHASGLAAGLQLTVWHFDLQLGVRDALARRREFEWRQISGRFRLHF